MKEEEGRLNRVREDLADQKIAFEKKKQSVRATLFRPSTHYMLLVKIHLNFLLFSVFYVFFLSRRRWKFKKQNRLAGQ